MIRADAARLGEFLRVPSANSTTEAATSGGATTTGVTTANGGAATTGSTAPVDDVNGTGGNSGTKGEARFVAAGYMHSCVVVKDGSVPNAHLGQTESARAS